MSLTAVLKTATSGLMAAQTGLRAVSDNIANVNTTGYVRKIVQQRPVVVTGTGMGVEVTGISRATDQYLQLASMTASSESNRWSAVSNYLDNVQGLFGDPSEDGYFFGRLDDIYGAFSAAANDPSSNLSRSQALVKIQDMLSESARINDQINQLGDTLDAKIKSDVQRANDLLFQIDKLNGDITRAKLVNQDAAGSENIQTQLLDELSTIMNIKVNQRSIGGIEIRSAEGVKLSGEGSATLSYNRVDGTPGYISAIAVGGATSQPIQINSGEIRGLLDLRNDQLPDLSDQLGEFMSRATEQLNAAHNASSAVPAPTTLTGRDTGLDIGTAASNFTGVSTVAIVNAQGIVQRRIDIDFSVGTMSVNGGPGVGFSPSSFVSDLNTALGGAGTASFAGGALSITAAGANGVAIDEGTSNKAGRGFSHFFGLNDLVRSQGVTNYDTGLKLTDPNGFNTAAAITVRLSQPDGKPITDVAITIPGGGSIANVVATLNNAGSGVGLYGQFSLDANGVLSFAGAPPQNATLSVISDNTSWNGTGPSISEMFGLGVKERGSRANRFLIEPAIANNPAKLALSKLNLSVPVGSPALSPGDGSGANALAASGERLVQFQTSGNLPGLQMTVSRYAMELSGAIGREASAAQVRSDSAEAVQTEANNRRQSVEGVNLDEELIRLTTYQQAFSASARMIQAAKELFDVLTNMS